MNRNHTQTTYGECVRSAATILKMLDLRTTAAIEESDMPTLISITFGIARTTVVQDIAAIIPFVKRT